MRVKYKEDPKAWRKSTLFTVVGLLLLSGLLRWRQVLTGEAWAGAVAVLLLLGLAVCLRPSLFRGYYRFSTWAGFWSSQWVARAVLVIIFALIIVPAGIITRLAGKDPLRLKRAPDAKSYWRPAKQGGSLDRLF
jgi:hypothetical protein